MSHVIEIYQKHFRLGRAAFHRIEHADAIIASVYRVVLPTQKSLILKVHPRNEDYFRELYFLDLLSKSLPVPRVIDHLDPDLGIEGAILMEDLGGHLMQKERLDQSLAYEVGSILAKLHSFRTEKYGDLTKLETLTEDPVFYFEEKFQEEIGECKDHLSFQLIEKCQAYYDQNKQLLKAVDGPCVVHRDFRPGNILVERNKLRGVIDWAGARSGFAEQDFCSIEHFNWLSYADDKKAFFQGYQKVRKIPDCLQLMPLLRLGRVLAIIGYTVRSKTWRGKNEGLYKQSLKYLEGFSF